MEIIKKIGNKKKLFRNFFLFFLIQCAQVIHPEGGPKDADAPILISTSIKNGDTNISPKEIIFKFNKRIRCSGRITITPSLEEGNDPGFEIMVKSKEIILKLTKKLQENTTYTINFGNSITDTTEFNPVENITLSFSTGEIIDQEELSGVVYDYFTKQLLKGAIVGLYEISDDGILNLNSEPKYTIMTDEKGNYRFSNIKKSKYRLIAYFGGSKSRKMNLSMSKFGAILEEIDLYNDNDRNKTYNIAVNQSDITPLQILDSKAQKNDYVITFNKKIAAIQTNLDDDLAEIVIAPNGEEVYFISKLKSWDESIEKEISIRVLDYSGDEILQPIKLELNKNSGEFIPSNFKLHKNNAREFPSLGNFKIISNKPIEKQGLKIYNIYLKMDGVELEILEENISIEDKNILVISYDLRNLITQKNEPTICELIIEEGSISDISGERNRKINKVFQVKHPEKVGSISGEVNVSAEGYTIQLINSKDEIIDEIKKIDALDHRYMFYGLSPDKYKIRVLLHEQFKEFWSTGNILKGIAPDIFIDMDKDIEILENWHAKNVYING